MPLCFFSTDLHGSTTRFEKLFDSLRSERPAAAFLGGDLFSRDVCRGADAAEFVHEFVVPRLRQLRDLLGKEFPAIFVILGNDDPRCAEPLFDSAVSQDLLTYVHGRRVPCNKERLGCEYQVYGYGCVPPTPFLMKDWERYDVSRYVPPACVSPEEGRRTVPVEPHETKWGTIKEDLAALTGDDDLSHAIFLFHAPPADTMLDMGAVDGQMYDHVPLCPHIGSIAVSRFIEQRQPLLTLHGHIHESTRLTGEWKIQIGRTVSINGAHDGPELALVRFDPAAPQLATRQLL